VHSDVRKEDIFPSPMYEVLGTIIRRSRECNATSATRHLPDLTALDTSRPAGDTARHIRSWCRETRVTLLLFKGFWVFEFVKPNSTAIFQGGGGGGEFLTPIRES